MATAEHPTAPLKVDKKVGVFRRMWAGLSILFASKIATVGLAIVLFWVIVAVFAPFIHAIHTVGAGLEGTQSGSLKCPHPRHG